MADLSAHGESASICSKEVLANFQIARTALCPEKFISERVQQRYFRRLRLSAGLAPPVIIRNFVTDAEIADIYRYVEERRCGRKAIAPVDYGRDFAASDAETIIEATLESDESDGPEPGSEAWIAEQMRLTASLCPDNFAYSEDVPGDENSLSESDDEPAQFVQCDEDHQKLYLHRRGLMPDGVSRTFGDACPALLAKVLGAAREIADSNRLSDAKASLSVRCIEFHNCARAAAAACLAIHISACLSSLCMPPERRHREWRPSRSWSLRRGLHVHSLCTAFRARSCRGGRPLLDD